MKLRATLGMIGLSLLTSGCQLTWDITRNLAFETYLCTDTVASKIHYRCMAITAWKEYSAGHPACTDSPFAKGFKEGYAEFLEEGGSECPPPAPPRRYWKLKYQNEEGRVATSRWAAGYREGVIAAKASGARNYIIIPINKCVPPQPPAPPPGATLPAPAAEGAAPAAEGDLPPPRPAAKESNDR
jgi:hypothetical protein